MKSLQPFKQSLSLKSFRKQGSLFIEYIIVLPIMILSLVFFCGIALFFYDGITTNILTNQISKTVIQETRGNPKAFNEIDPEEKEIIKQIVAEQVLDSYVSPFAELRYENGRKVSSDVILHSMIIDDPADCKEKINQKQRVICIEGVSLTNDDTVKEEIKVEIFAPYHTFPFVNQFIDYIHSTNTTLRELGRTNNFW